MKKSVSTLLFFALVASLCAQTPTAEKDNSGSFKTDFTKWIRQDVELSDRQTKEIDALNTWTLAEMAAMEKEYEINPEVRQNKLHLIMEERDARLANILSIEQFAIYLNNQLDDLAYNSYYEGENITIKKRKSGKIKVKSEKGKIRITDDKLIVKNPATEEKTTVKRNEIEYTNKQTGEVVEVEENKVEIETAVKEEQVKKSSATKKTDSKEVNIKK